MLSSFCLNCSLWGDYRLFLGAERNQKMSPDHLKIAHVALNFVLERESEERDYCARKWHLVHRAHFRFLIKTQHDRHLCTANNTAQYCAKTSLPINSTGHRFQKRPQNGGPYLYNVCLLAYYVFFVMSASHCKTLWVIWKQAYIRMAATDVVGV